VGGGVVEVGGLKLTASVHLCGFFEFFKFSKTSQSFSSPTRKRRLTLSIASKEKSPNGLFLLCALQLFELEHLRN
jgi:hypothetical protein